MQKKIIALAVAGLMSGAAFAQSNVTISGLFDAGLVNAKTQNNTSSNNAGYNNTGTSNITFAATEDLGGGMKAGMLLESDVRGSGTVAGFQHYVWIGGGFGTISLGQRTNFTTTTATTIQPYGTAMGGGYAGAATGYTNNRLRGGGFGATGAFSTTTDTRDVRPNGVLDYRTPNFSGLTAGLQYMPKNNDATETSASTGYLGIGVNYNNGPLNLSFADSSAKNTGAVVNGVDKVDHTLFGGNYTFGPATVYAGYTKSKAVVGGVTTADSSSWNVALKYAITPALAVSGNILRDNDKLAANTDRTLNALGLDYALSKRTTAYARNVWGDADKSNAAAGKFRQTVVGLKHAF